MVLTLLPGTAKAADSGSCGTNANWSLENGVLTISGSGAMSNYSGWYGSGSPGFETDAPWNAIRNNIKEIIIQEGITAIGSYSFCNCEMLSQITIPNSVGKIGRDSFRGCKQLRNIVIPEGVTTIDVNMFNGCENLTGAEIPDSVTRIEAQAFAGCESLTNITLPEHINYIGQAAFVSAGLTSVELPEGLTTIAKYAFDRCTNLKDVTIPSSTISIGDDAFSYCTSLTAITIPDSVRTIGSGAFTSCTGLTAVTISDGVESIGSFAFGNCVSLTTIFIPSSVTNIGSSAFAGSQIREIRVDENNPRYRAIDGVLYTKDLSTLVMCPPGRTERIVIPDGVTTFESGEYTGPLNGCEKLTGLTIPSSVTTTGFVQITEAYGEEPRRDAWGAFINCPGLTSAGPIGSGCDIEFGWTSVIPGATFEQATALKSVILPEGLTSLDYTFSECSGLETVHIPSSVENIGEKTFYGCSSLTTLVIPDSVTSIGKSAFRGCTSLTSLTIPKSVTDIDPYGLEWGRDCPNLTIYCYKDSAAHQYAQRFGIRFELLDDDSKPSAVSIQSVALTKNGMTMNLLTQTAEFELGSSEMAAVSANVNWDSENNGRTFLIQDRDTYVELPTSFTPGTVFNSDDPVYVIATNAAADTLLDWKEIKLQIVQSTPPTAPQITITPETLDLSVGKTEDITVTTTPTGARYTLTSSDPEVVSVSGNTLTAHKLGRGEITATLVDYPNVQAVCSVAVKEGYDDLMCAIAANQLVYEDELIRYGFGTDVSVFVDAAIDPNRQLWNGYIWDAKLADFYKDVLGDWKIINVASEPSGLFAVALYNSERNQEIIAFRGTESLADVEADFEFAVLNKLPKQFEDALNFYERSAGGGQEILLTGHSLGGAIACYISLLTGERAELFNAANGLIMEDAYFAGGEDIYRNFHGTDCWNFTNHVTESRNSASQFSLGTAALNEKVAYPNADKLPVEIHAVSGTATSDSVLKNSAHDLCSMLEYDRSAGRFWLTQSTPYILNLSAVRQFEMTRVDLLFFAEKVFDKIQKPKWIEAIIEIVKIYENFSGEDHLKVRFDFGSSGDDDITDSNLIVQAFLSGGDGNDFLTGGCINDVLVGGLGVNAMDGGPMNDLYVITGTGDQYINDCSGVDDIYIPSGVRVRSYGNPTDMVDEYYVLTLTNGQRIMINKNRKQDFDNRFCVYSMDGTYCGSYRTVLQEAETRMIALAAEDEPAEAANGLPITTLEMSGRDLILEIQDDAGNSVGTVTTTTDSFPLYKPYGYFYYDRQEETLRAHLFGGSGEVRISSADPAAQTVACTSIFHAANDDLPLKRFTAEIDLQSSETILTPSCVAEEPAVPFRIMDSNGNTEDISAKTEDLTVSQKPDNPEQPTHYTLTVIGGSGSGSYSAGTRISISATVPSGKRFVRWESSGGTFEDYLSASTYFIMPNGDVTLTAILTDKSTGGTSGGSSSSGGWSTNAYTVTVEKSEHGKVTSNRTNTSSGNTVILTATPDSGYVLDTLTVTDSRGNGIKLTTQGSGKYTFTMPTSNVTVTAEFERTSDGSSSGETSGGGSSGGGDSSGGTSGDGTSSGNSSSGGTSGGGSSSGGTSGGGTSSGGTSGGNSSSGGTSGGGSSNGGTSSGNNGWYPGGGYDDGDNSLGGGDDSYTPSYQITTPTASNGTVTVSPRSASFGDKVTITATPDSGYTTGSVTVKNSSGKSIAVTDNGDGTYTFTMPASRVTIGVTFDVIEAPAPYTDEPEETHWVTPFPDVSENDWFYGDVAYVTQHGLMNGMDGGFNPGGTATRGMIMTILARMAGVNTSGSSPWYRLGMEWAVQNGVSDGTSPEGEITREQFTAMLWRHAGEPAVTGNLSAYPDAGDVHADWAGSAMIWAVQNDIIRGSDGRLNPRSNATRAEAAAMLTRFCKYIEK